MKEILIRKHDRGGVWGRSSGKKGVAGDEASPPAACWRVQPGTLPRARDARGQTQPQSVPPEEAEGRDLWVITQRIHRDSTVPRKADRGAGDSVQGMS